MNQTHATAFALAAAYREVPAGHLMTRVEAARRVARLLDLTPVGAAGRRITEAIEAGDLVELSADAGALLTIPGAPADAVVWVAPGDAEGTVEVRIGDAEGTVEAALGGPVHRSAPRLPLTRRPLVIPAADRERLAEELRRLWEQVRTAAEVSPEAIGAALSAAGLPGMDDAPRGWWVTHSGATGRPMVVHTDRKRFGPRRSCDAECQEWAERLGAIENALATGGFLVARVGHTVQVNGRTGAGGAGGAGPVCEEQPADVVRLASRTVRAAHSAVSGVRTYLHVNCGCRLASSLEGTYAGTAEALAAERARAAELGVAYVPPVACRKNRPERTATPTAAVPQPAAEPAVEQPAQDPAERSAARRRGAVEAVRELLTAAGVSDLDAVPYAETGFKAQPAPRRVGVWVWVRRIAPTCAAGEWEQTFGQWSAVLRHAGWDVVRADEFGFYTTAPAALIAATEQPAAQSTEPAGRSTVRPVVTVRPARWLLLAAGMPDPATPPAAPAEEPQELMGDRTLSTTTTARATNARRGGLAGALPS